MPGASLNVPHFKQEFPYSCVPACARMVLAFFGSHHTEAELRVLMRTDPNGTPVRRLTELTQHSAKGDRARDAWNTSFLDNRV